MSEVIHSKIWEEIAEKDNPFAAAACYCRGYDVYGDLLGSVRWPEYLYLLFRGERPAAGHTAALDALAIALANPGPRDLSVHAAMCAGVGGSPAASALMAALAVGAGGYGGGREVFLAVMLWQECGSNLATWRAHRYAPNPPERASVWPDAEHVPGFDPHGASCSMPVRQTLAHLAAILPDGHAAWLAARRGELEKIVGLPLAMSGVAAATLADIGFSPTEAEMLFLLLRLPGAAAHALEQWEVGFRHFPFFEVALENDTAARHEEDRL